MSSFYIRKLIKKEKKITLKIQQSNQSEAIDEN